MGIQTFLHKNEVSMAFCSLVIIDIDPQIDIANIGRERKKIVGLLIIHTIYTKLVNTKWI